MNRNRVIAAALTSYLTARNLEAAHDHCRAIAHRHGANFSVGFRFLPRPKRRAVYAAYAFCRYADDIVDEEIPAEASPLAILDRWEAELDACYEGRPRHPITLALADALGRYPIPKESFRGLIEGCRMDLAKSRYRDFAELKIYCDLVATTISALSLAIFGYRNAEARERGADLATALQLTNITRDVGDDLRRDRIYLPQEDLEHFGVREEDLFARRLSENFSRLMAHQVERARGYYRRAAPLLGMLEADARFGVKLMGGIYARVLDKVEARGYRVLEGSRIGLSRFEKILLPARLLGQTAFLPE